jgi:hypothetical protein
MLSSCSINLPNFGGFIKGILRGVRCTKSLRVLFLHRRLPSWTTLVLYSRAVFIFNEPAFCPSYKHFPPTTCFVNRVHTKLKLREGTLVLSFVSRLFYNYGNWHFKSSATTAPPLHNSRLESVQKQLRKGFFNPLALAQLSVFKHLWSPGTDSKE